MTEAPTALLLPLPSLGSCGNADTAAAAAAAAEAANPTPLLFLLLLMQQRKSTGEGSHGNPP